MTCRVTDFVWHHSKYNWGCNKLPYVVIEVQVYIVRYSGTIGLRWMGIGDLPPHGNIKIYRLCYIASCKYRCFFFIEYSGKLKNIFIYIHSKTPQSRPPNTESLREAQYGEGGTEYIYIYIYIYIYT